MMVSGGDGGTRGSPRGKHGIGQSGSTKPSEGQPISRRHFLRGAAGLGGVAAVGAAGYGIYEGTRRNPPRLDARRGKPRTLKSVAESPSTKLEDGVTLPVSPAIIAENAKPGDVWWVTTPQAPGGIEGYASQVSAVAGEKVTLYVSTTAPTFHVEVFRMGYYQGVAGRKVWTSPEVRGVRQPAPTLLAPTNTIECGWTPSLTVRIDASWLPGAYLLKLVGPTSEQQFVPLCVRDDASKAAIVIQHSVSTWQAYNRWGGYSLYSGNDDGTLSYSHAAGPKSNYASRARIVSFDRPYDHDWASGAADFVGNELPVIFQAERLGMDVTYWTDVDLHARPGLLANHKAMISLGHDEYWSTPMRQGAVNALAKGVNFAFLGANACYRQIRFQSSAVGENRQQICYKDAAEDPLFHVDNALVTVNWPQPPVLLPESLLIGSTYQDVGAQADMVITDASSWLFAGTGLAQGQHLSNVVVGEFDRYVPGAPGPTNLDVVAHSIVPNRRDNYSDVTWYTVPGGGGVFASGNASWVGNLVDATDVPGIVIPEPNPEISAPLLRVMENLYSVIGRGPASATQPSQGNWRQTYAGSSVTQGAPAITS